MNHGRHGERRARIQIESLETALKLYKLDKASSDMAYDFLQKPDSKTMVSAEVVMTGDTVKLVKVMNAE